MNKGYLYYYLFQGDSLSKEIAKEIYKYKVLSVMIKAGIGLEGS